MELKLKNFRIEQDDRGVLTALLDVPGRSHNVIDQSVMLDLEALVDALEKTSDVKLVVFRSAKESGFLAGADVSAIADLQDSEEAAAISRAGQQIFTRIEQLPMPSVAVIHGPCLGGGLEFALACTYRVARDDAKTRIGLPEVQLGVIPGWGGTQRLPRLIGVVSALTMILTAKKQTAKAAEKIGLVNSIASADFFESHVQEFISCKLRGERNTRRPKRKQSWTGWFLDHTRLGQWLTFRATAKRIARESRHYPALTAALQSVQTGMQRSEEAGLQYEAKAFGDLVVTPTSRNLVQLFFDRERARVAKTWACSPESDNRSPANEIQRICVVGAGVMGAGIAQLAAYSGLQVLLKDVDDQTVQKGMRRIEELFDGAVRAGRLRPEEAKRRLDAVTPIVDWEMVDELDLVIEAVVEREDIKKNVFEELDRLANPTAILATNTSSLSVDRLAQATNRPQQVAGLHFFNPVHRMELVEVVGGELTNAETVQRLVRLVRRLGKTPVVVADSPGFLVNRVLFPYLGEAVRLLCEGFEVTQVDRAMKSFGMPMGPLQLLDQVGVDVAANVAQSMAGTLIGMEPVAQQLARMVEEGRLGKKTGGGFYEYQAGRRGKAAPWPKSDPAGDSLSELVTALEGQLSYIQQRLVLPIINESARCLGEHVVREAWMVDVAMVLGTGFAPFHGGPLNLADQLGVEQVVESMSSMAELHGQRYSPCETLREHRITGQRFREHVSATASTPTDVQTHARA